MAKEDPLWEKPFLRKRANWFVPAGLNFPAYPPLRPPARRKGQESEGEREEVRTRNEKKDGEIRGS